MDDIDLRENVLLDKFEGLRADIEAIQQPRSNYAIEHFVIGQHRTPGRQRIQTLAELQVKLFSIQRAQLSIKKLETEIEILTKKKRWTFWNEDLLNIEIQNKQVDIVETNLARLGNIREAEFLYEILQKLPAYTAEQYQAEEEEYYLLRLEEQGELHAQNALIAGTVGEGNAQAIRQMGRGLVTELDQNLITRAAVNLLPIMGKKKDSE